MKRNVLRIIVLAGVTAVSSMALADSSGFRIVVPMPPPTSRPSEADMSAITDAQNVFDNARKDAIAAHADLIKAQVELNRITMRLQNQLESDNTLVFATNVAEGAKSRYEELTQPILASLADSAPYRDARAVLAKAQQAADEFRVRPDASTEERFAVAQAVLQAKETVSRLENAALNSHSDVVTAKKNYLDATQRLKTVRIHLLQSLYQDPAYVAASQAVSDALEKAAAADQQFATAKLDLYAAQRRLADKQDSRQQILDWTYRHGLPDPP
jgi:hypothetical protein